MNHLPVHKTIEGKNPATENSSRHHALNLPNLVTVSRIFLVPIFIVLFSSPTVWRSWMAALVFAVAALTDWLDGYLARSRSEITTIGRLLDPIADKLLVISGLILLVEFQRLAAWVAIVMIGREIVVTGIRGIAATQGSVISAGTAGKYKVILQVAGILILILQEVLIFSPESMNMAGIWVLYMAMVLSVVSGLQYFLQVYRELQAQE